MKKMIVLLLSFMLSVSVLAQDIQVFETVLRDSETVDLIADRIAGQLEDAGYTVLSNREVGSDAECPGSVKVISAWYPDGADALFGLNALTAPYGLVERVAVYNDGSGTWVSTVNPGSVLRTVFLDNAAAEGIASQQRVRLRTALGADMERAYGQKRSRGKIGKTMGVMAGGPFDEKLGELASAEGATVEEVADLISTGFDAQQGDWGMELAYRLDIPERDLVVFGVSSARMEAKSFSIVGAGSDKERKDLTCAGTAYAPSYPIEVVVRTSNGAVKVEAVDAMFRMKLFFEDAGKWAFMKNMTMPGSLASEMKDRIDRAIAGSGI